MEPSPFISIPIAHPSLFAEIDLQPRGKRDEKVPVGIPLIFPSNAARSARAVSDEAVLTEEGAVPTDTRKLAEHIEFWSSRLLWKTSVAAKLHEAGDHETANTLDHCRTEASVKRCTQCGKQTVFWNRCDSKFCPACTPRLARERKQSVEAWSQWVGQPKHVILTARNSEEFTEETITKFKDAFTRLRHRKFCKQHTEEVYACELATRKPLKRYSYKWLGGFYALEVTKESKGWHLHLHALVNAKFIDSVMLAREWAECIGQDVAIVKVKDAREGEYLQELLKYVVKGDQLAAWPAKDVAAFVQAFKNQRTFGVFGELYKHRAEFRAELNKAQMEPEPCECGCRHWEILTDREDEWRELTSGNAPSAPRCKFLSQMDFNREILHQVQTIAAMAR